MSVPSIHHLKMPFATPGSLSFRTISKRCHTPHVMSLRVSTFWSNARDPALPLDRGKPRGHAGRKPPLKDPWRALRRSGVIDIPIVGVHDRRAPLTEEPSGGWRRDHGPREVVLSERSEPSGLVGPWVAETRPRLTGNPCQGGLAVEASGSGAQQRQRHADSQVSALRQV